MAAGRDGSGTELSMLGECSLVSRKMPSTRQQSGLAFLGIQRRVSAQRYRSRLLLDLEFMRTNRDWHGGFLSERACHASIRLTY